MTHYAYPLRLISLLSTLLLFGCLSAKGHDASPARPNHRLNDSNRDVVWQADHETNDLSQWTQGQRGEAVFNSGTGEVTLTDEVARSGLYSLALTIRDAEDAEQAVRIFRWDENLQSGYYSAWYYFPRRYDVPVWWNVFQFKTRDEEGVSRPTWVLNVGNRGDEMAFYLYDALEDRTYADSLTDAPLLIPTERWVHVEAYYQRETDDSGRIAVWQDGVKLYDIEGVQTALTDYSDWSVTNYTNHIHPNTATIYVDDAAISKTQLGPSEEKAERQ